MKRPFNLTIERPRKGSIMTSVYDPSVGSFVLAERMASGRLVVHERLEALAMLNIAQAKEFCLRAGAAWSSTADLAAG